jgi:hypothetical protein
VFNYLIGKLLRCGSGKYWTGSVCGEYIKTFKN